MKLPTHLLLDAWGMDRALLSDPQRLESILRAAAHSAQCRVLGVLAQRFEPEGATVLLLLAESHLSVHTWPEHDYAAVDLLTCGEALPTAGVEALVAGLAPQRHLLRRLDRGAAPAPFACETGGAP
jgi:S-adenosylmethionine decarboxylase proenzyme